jgi:hypothetical protein
MYYINVFKVLLLVITILFVTACSDGNDPNEDDNDHARGIGIQITSSGQTVVSYEGDGALTGSLSAVAGELSAAYFFLLIDEDGETYTPEEDHHELRFTVADTTIVTTWQHEGEEGGFEFHLQGKAEGQTTIIFTVYHEDHPDFVSRDIPVEVVAPTP